MGKYSDFLLTVDYDGTLTDGHDRIPEENLIAIREFMAEGGAFTLNTGRSLPMCSSILGKVPVNAPLLLYNGGAAYDTETGKMVFSKPIDLPMWETLEKAQALVPEMLLELQGLRNHYAFRMNKSWGAICTMLRCPHEFAEFGQVDEPFLKFSLLGPFKAALSAEIFDGNAEDEPKISVVTERLRDTFGDAISIFHSGARILDMQAAGVSKGVSARWLKDTLGKKYLICMGDAANDISMLEAADYAFAPSDGVIADRFPTVCPCAEGSVAEVIYKKIPKILDAALDNSMISC